MISAIAKPKVGVMVATLAVVLGAVAGAQAAPTSRDGRDARSANPSPADLAGIEQAERTWARALETGDPALLESLVDDEMSFIGPDGQIEDRAAYLAGYRALPAMGVKVEKIDVDQMKVRVLGETAVVTGHVLARVHMGPDAIVEDVRFTRVYQRRGSRWRMVAGQGTRIAPPAPPATTAAPARR